MDISETGVPATRVRFSEAWHCNQIPYKFSNVASTTPPLLLGVKRGPIVSPAVSTPVLGFDL